MKLKQFQSELEDEIKARFTGHRFPVQILELLDNLPKNNIKSFIRNEVAKGQEDPVLESIILAFNRPSFLIKDNKFNPSPSETWNSQLSPYISSLSKKVAGVGRIELKNHESLDWAGTGFLVEDSVICTNRHVAENFVQTTSQGYEWRINSLGKTVMARIDFLEEYSNPSEKEIELIETLYIEPLPGPDIAFFRIRLDEHIEPLELNTDSSIDDVIVTVGYPWKDSRVSPRIEQVMKRIFGDIYDVKRIAPGRIVSKNGNMIHHDCTTLGGNSGSAILDVETGKVVGIHCEGGNSFNKAVSAKIISDRLKRF